MMGAAKAAITGLLKAWSENATHVPGIASPAEPPALAETLDRLAEALRGGRSTQDCSAPADKFK